MGKLFQQDEPEDVRAELVEMLVDSSVPILVLAATMTAIGAHTLGVVASSAVLAATVAGPLACLAKLAVMVRHCRALRAGRRGGLPEILKWERRHAASTLAVAGSVGWFAAAILVQTDVGVHLGATSVLFAYCAGVINRLSIRPRVALAALFCAGVPGIAAAAADGGSNHLILALVFTSFLLAAIQSVGYAYGTALRSVTLRLHMAGLARRDPLTGLHNRLGLREAFDALPRNGRGLVAVHAFDLDGFKAVNDEFGHAAGDRLLPVLSARIRPIAPDTAIIARTGGDEFILIQTGLHGADEAGRLAQRLHDELAAAHHIGGDRPVRVGLSLGYALSPLAEADLDDLTRRADEASYVAKRAGGGICADGGLAAPSLVPPLARPRQDAMAPDPPDFRASGLGPEAPASAGRP